MIVLTGMIRKHLCLAETGEDALKIRLAQHNQ